MKQRDIREIRTAHPSRDGDGVAIQRIAGMRDAGMDPILMIDELLAEHREDFGGGFPSHPHRGMQTLTYMKQGGIIHEDSHGNRGEIRGGGAQWMSAGRGIIHSEMPTQDSDGLHGFQLWVNLPAAQKMSQPRYRDVPADELVQWRGEGVEATLIAGQWQFGGDAMRGPLEELAEHASVIDLVMTPKALFETVVPGEENLVGYVYDGSVESGGREVLRQQMLITGEGDALTLQSGDEGARLLLLRGRPLAEPVANYGPFVMNTSEEIEQALRDYQSGQFG
jgi:quercetin 2,3-dioxygenase